MEGHFVKGLKSLFKPENRKFIKQLELELAKNFREERSAMEKVVGGLLTQINEALIYSPEAVREALGCDVNAEEGQGQEKRRWFRSLNTEQARKDYTKRVTNFLIFTGFLLKQENREKANFQLDRGTLSLIKVFHNGPQTAFDIQKFVLSLLRENRVFQSTYNKELLCLYPIAILLSAEGSFVNGEAAQKTVSSLKFLCRGCSLLKIQSLEAEQVSEYETLSKQLAYYTGATHAFACLFRLHKGMNLISGSVRGATTFYDGNRLFVGAADFSLEKLRLTVQGLYLDSQKLPVVPLNVHTERGAKKFLESCIRYERIALVLMHFLMGCTSRATDYQHFKVSDLESINSELLLLHRTCQKNTLLKGVKQQSPVVLPKKLFGYVKKYYELVRPRCVEAAKRLGKPEPIVNGK